MTTKQRKALGRGFGALLKAVDEQGVPDNTAGIHQLDIDQIAFNPQQPRQSIDPEKLEELVQSIKIKGVIQPILVRPKSDSEAAGFELVAGERRLRAARLAGFGQIPAIVRTVKDQDLLEIALIENVQRDNLNPIEEANAYRNLLEAHGYTQEVLSKRIGKNRSTIANLIRLLRLPERLQEDVARNRLSTGHARCLLSVEDPESQMRLRNRIINEQLPVREIEKLLKSGKTANPIRSSRKEKPVDSLPEQLNLNQDRLREHYATQVRIRQSGEKGKIEFEYYNSDDFNRIFALLMK